MDILQFKQADCKNCFKCLRECSVKAIAFRNGQAEILKDDCLLCGHCMTVCPQNAKVARIDTGEAKKLIESGKKVVASVAPSFIAAFDTPDFSSFEEALKKLGFSAAFECSVGAAVVAEEYRRLLESGNYKNLISSCCPTVVKLIEKYYPTLLGCLAPVLSPMSVSAKMIKEKYEHEIYVVFIGPCLCKKDEAEWEDSGVDCVITFEELQNWFTEEGVLLSPGANKPTSPPFAARLFPVSGGILRSVGGPVNGFESVTVDGLDKCREVLDELLQKHEDGYFIEMSACSESCVNGPCMNRPSPGGLKARKSVEIFASKSASGLCEPLYPKQPPAGIRRQFKPQYGGRNIPGEKQLRAILAETGKFRPEQELNCGACGYRTCREKAIAVFQGKAEVSMCVPYMRQRAEYISNEIISFTPNAIVALDIHLQIQAMNEAACRMFAVSNAKDYRGKYVGELVDPDVFEEAVLKKQNILNRRTYLYLNGITVEQSVIYVQEHNFVFGMFRDLTDIEREKEKLKKVRLDTVETADKVIEKQMRVVQEIAMLLGETTAETKVVLTKLKNAMISDADNGKTLPPE